MSLLLSATISSAAILIVLTLHNISNCSHGCWLDNEQERSQHFKCLIDTYAKQRWLGSTPMDSFFASFCCYSMGEFPACKSQHFGLLVTGFWVVHLGHVFLCLATLVSKLGHTLVQETLRTSLASSELLCYQPFSNEVWILSLRRDQLPQTLSML